MQFLNNNVLQCQTDPFVKLLLKRLSIMETMATIKFRQLPVEDSHRELIIMTHLRRRCKTAGYSINKTGLILSVFSENMRLAKFIQTACFHEWEMMPDETIKAMGLTSARAIISDQLSSHALMESLREYINHTTNAMFDTLRIIKQTPEMNALIEPLITCFPRINRRDLEKTISNIMESVTKLATLPTLKSTI